MRVIGLVRESETVPVQKMPEETTDTAKEQATEKPTKKSETKKGK